MATLVLLVLLAIVWAGVGIYWLRTRAASAPSLSIGSYSRRMPARSVSQGRGQLADLQAFGRGPVQSPLSAMAQQQGHDRGGRTSSVSSNQARLRRRNLLICLAAVSIVTLLGVVTLGGTTMILVHLVADALLLGFVLLLVQYQRAIELERTMNRPVYASVPGRRLAPTGTEGHGVGVDVFAR